jgi:hypothetical protein
MNNLSRSFQLRDLLLLSVGGERGGCWRRLGEVMLDPRLHLKPVNIKLMINCAILVKINQAASARRWRAKFRNRS